MIHDFSATGFPSIFSDLVASACMNLPPLINEGDDDFLRLVTGKAINTFWMEYIGALPEPIQQELRTAMEQEDKDATLNWFAQYADFPGEPSAQSLASVIIDELAEQMPTLVKEDYQEYRSLVPVTA